METTSTDSADSTVNIVRSIIRGNYSIQKLRIQVGNRVTQNFKGKLGISSEVKSEAELEKQAAEILAILRESYIRITDGVVSDTGEAVLGKLPSVKKFIGDEFISKYSELVLVDQYMELLRNEELQFKQLSKILIEVPVYTKFLQG